MKLRSSLFLTLFLAACASVQAFSTGPPPMRSGVPGEADGASCALCHRNADGSNVNDGRGRIAFEAREYRPGRKQAIRVILEHPDALRWGFQITIRSAANPLQSVGTFTAVAGAIRVVCSGGMTVQPCPAGQNEFVTHLAATTFAGTRSRAEWEIEWTPPADLTGDVIIYGSGNAANNSGTAGANSGDFIYTSNATLRQESCNLPAPTISAVRNAGSFVDGNLSLNTLIAIGGSGFQAAGQVRRIGTADFENGRFPTEASCIAVEVAGRRAPITYAQANQINAQVPTVSDRGTVAVVAIANPGTSNERRSAAVNVTLAATSPAFFRLLPTPCIAAVFAATGQVTGDPALLQGVRGVRPGDIIAMYATGLGQLDPVYQAGEVMEAQVRVREAVTVEWAGTALAAADVSYVGAVPGLISGVYQINIRVPNAVTSNAQNQVRLRAGGVLSPEGTTIFVAPQ